MRLLFPGRIPNWETLHNFPARLWRTKYREAQQ